LYVLAARVAPSLASGLITFGIASNHAEVIAIGVTTAVVAAGEVIWRLTKGRK